MSQKTSSSSNPPDCQGPVSLTSPFETVDAELGNEAPCTDAVTVQNEASITKHLLLKYRTTEIWQKVFGVDVEQKTLPCLGEMSPSFMKLGLEFLEQGENDKYIYLGNSQNGVLAKNFL